MALTKKREILARDLAFLSHPMAAGVVLYAGAMSVLNADGFVQPGTEAEGLICVGTADETVDNSNGADGALNATTRIDRARRYDNDILAPITRSDIMSDCFIKDDVTVSSEGVGRSRAGKIVDVDADGVWVAFT